ncbi:restriction endonuclease [Streptomyces sp. NPDC127084]|uniref:restriction endonuclease n=1 Tax=Streptomyces sp. NPDC127084 TaxID=3347133 RepID=UPI00364BF8E2
MTLGSESLQSWLATVMDPAKLNREVGLPDLKFPTGEIFDEFIQGIRQRSDEEVIAVLDRLLLPNTCLIQHDKLFWLANYDPKLETIAADSEEERERRISFLKGPRYASTRQRFLLENDRIFPWEGLTWVRKLLPDRPALAIQALEAYLIANFWNLPDDLIHGLSDAQAVIRANYIGFPEEFEERRELFYGITPREFEFLAVRLYQSMGYEAEATPASGDGGKDGICHLRHPGRSEKVLLEMKRHKDPIGPSVVRELHGTVSLEHANRGVLIASSTFTSDAHEIADQSLVELINGQRLCVMLNEHLGYTWPARLEYLIRDTGTSHS